MRIFSRGHGSLFGEILDWMLTPLLLLWPISLALTWLVAQGLANKPFDRALVYNAQILSQLVRHTPGQTSTFTLSQPASEILRADEVDLVFYQVKEAQGGLLAGEKALPEPPEQATRYTDEVLLRDVEMRGLELRVAYTWVRGFGSDAPAVLVQVAETREKRSVLAAEIIKGVMLPQFLVLPLATLLVWLALVRGIKPLSELELRILKRRSDDLSPLDAQAVPMEVAPLVMSVNDLLKRLQKSISTQKRFLADAAHQLKTPLAGLRMQADLALRQDSTQEELKLSLKQIERSSIRATHTVNQLLSLARTEEGATRAAFEPCNMVVIISDVIQDSLPMALEKGLDVGYEGPSEDAPGVSMMGNATLLKEMVRNLLDNAIHYTNNNATRQGVVTVRLLAQPWRQSLALQVEDNGPGIAVQERELVLQPFYRALGTQVDGSGLGLSIVQEVVSRHKATLQIEDAKPGQQPPGTLITVRFSTNNTSP
jgi:two-component system, OmpR family, sensor histidine kinase TctE